MTLYISPAAIDGQREAAAEGDEAREPGRVPELRRERLAELLPGVEFEQILRRHGEPALDRQSAAPAAGSFGAGAGRAESTGAIVTESIDKARFR